MLNIYVLTEFPYLFNESKEKLATMLAKNNTEKNEKYEKNFKFANVLGSTTVWSENLNEIHDYLKQTKYTKTRFVRKVKDWYSDAKSIEIGDAYAVFKYVIYNLTLNLDKNKSKNIDHEVSMFLTDYCINLEELRNNNLKNTMIKAELIETIKADDVNLSKRLNDKLEFIENVKREIEWTLEK